jgi:hypothetical protein
MQDLTGFAVEKQPAFGHYWVVVGGCRGDWKQAAQLVRYSHETNPTVTSTGNTALFILR